MNVTLLRKVQAKLRRLKHPAHFNMDHWAQKTDCGTAACIAGHVLLVSGYKAGPIPKWQQGDYMDPESQLMFTDLNGQKVNNPGDEAAMLLDLNSQQELELFYDEYWPDRFKVNGNDPKKAADRIEDFIQEYEKDGEL